MVNSRSPKSTSTRRRLSVEDRRDELVRVGVELIATRPWDQLTMNDIAAAASVSKPLLYHYFSAKNDLYIAAIRSAAEQLSTATAPDPTLPAKARLRAALRVHVEWVEANATVYRTLLQGGVSVDAEVQAIIEASRLEVVQRITHSLDLDEAPPLLRIALRGWVGFLEFACLDWVTNRDITQQQLVEMLAASLPGVIIAADL